MRLLILAAAVANVIHATPAPTVDTEWDHVVSLVGVDNGVIVDYKNPQVGVRPTLTGAGRFGGQALRYTGTERLLLQQTPFALNYDFTIEGHFMFDEVTTSNQYMMDLGNNGFTLRYYRSGPVNGVCVYQGGSTLIAQSSFVPTPGTWFHCAVVRRGGLVQLYIDGILQGQGTYSTGMAYTSLAVGNFGGGGSYSIRGRIDQFRITTKANYLANFTPPNAAFLIGGAEATFDPYWTNVNLLIDSAANGNMVDSKSGQTVEKVGMALISSSIRKLGTASMQVGSAANEFFRVQDTGDIYDFGSGEWCVECWVYPTQTVSGYTQLVGRHASGNAGGWVLGLNNMSPVVRVSAISGSWQTTLTATGATIANNRWTHVAASRLGNTLNIFVDGKLCNSVSVTGSLVASTLPVTIGATNGGGEQFVGNIDSVRITRGKARYVQNFTPKMQTAFSTNGTIGIPANDPYFSLVSGFAGYDRDLGASLRQWTPATIRSSSALDSSRKLFNESTLTLTTGATGGINYNNGTKTTLGAIDSTAEGWINTDYTAASLPLPIVGQHHASSNGAWILAVTGGKALFFIRGGIQLLGTKDIADSQWHHVAVSIRAGVAYLYVDGTLEASGSVGGVYPTYNGNIQVGYNISTEAAAGFRCNLARIRLTQGQGRYSSNFVPVENTIQLKGMAA